MEYKNYQVYDLGDITLESNKIIEKAQLAFKTFGSLNEDKTNVIIYPTWYSGFIADNEWLIGNNKALNPEKYFIIIIALFGNGESSSPSNNKTFSNCTIYDNVMNQYRLVTELFKIKSVELVVGWSMGAQQCYQWACLYPEMVKRIAPFCGASKTSPHNWIFLESLRYVLQMGKTQNHIKLFARIYAGWGFTQEFYKKEEWRNLGYISKEDFIEAFWEEFFLRRNPDNLETLLWTWQNGNISKNEKYRNDWVKSLASIKAKSLILSPNNDLYFPKEDNIDEFKILKNCILQIIPGIYGHFAGGGINQDDIYFIDNELKYFLNQL